MTAEPDEAPDPRTGTLRFFALTFVWAWTFWLVGSVVAPDASSNVRALFFLPGTFAPAIIGIWLTRREGGGATRRLLDRLGDWDVGARWYAFAVVYMAGIKLAAASVLRASSGAWPAFGATPWYLLFAAVPFSTPVQAGEEIGWRGFALPRLVTRFGIGRASVLLGVVWALWHLPLFYIAGTDSTGQPFLPYLLAVTALSVALAWLWTNTRRALLPVMVMHAAINNTAAIVPSAPVRATDPLSPSTTPLAWLTVALLWICAAFFIYRMRSGSTR